jgi:16S rRNA (cytosine967-C5)-methyltransferase
VAGEFGLAYFTIKFAFMSRYYSYINSAKQILNEYHGSEPFALFLKKFFAADKKYGSKDRKQISHLCYCFFRLGNAFETEVIEERIVIGLFLTAQSHNNLLFQAKPEWNEQVHLLVIEKIAFLNASEEWNSIFILQQYLSSEIDKELFITALFIQPNLHLRLRPHKEKIVKEKLTATQIEFSVESENCLSLPNASKLDGLIQLDSDAVIQDYSSQKVLGLLQLPTTNHKPQTATWDCCAASGGKSILAYDTIPNINLTVSDIRSSILINLKKRFESAGINTYKSFVADLSNAPLTTHHSPFDLIICDAPCSGSGTWSRTPEHIIFFKEEKIEEYANLQKKIAVNASKSLKKGGHFLYITCSVFKKENEEVVEYLKQNTSLKLKAMHYYKGYDKKADTLFAALFTL